MRQWGVAGGLICATIAVGVWFTVQSSSAKHWCCLTSFDTGLGMCFREEQACIPSDKVRVTSQERAACFDWRAVIRDIDLEHCNATMSGCRGDRTKIIEEGEGDRITECRIID